MDAVEQRLLYKFDEINALGTMISVGGLGKDYARQLFRDSLEDAYLDGFAASEYMLQREEEIDEELLLLAVDKEYNGESIYTKFDNYYEQGDAEAMQRLMESEFHRAYSQGQMDMATATGGDLYKTWVTMRDDRVRETHDYLEGMKIPINEPFLTYDMDEAMYPGGFSLPENNVNCRCTLKITES